VVGRVLLVQIPGLRLLATFEMPIVMP
jgi:hypothetical protein